MKKLLLLGLLATASSQALACTYTAWISDDNKYNSKGVFLAGSATKSAAAAVLRQERADSGSYECGLGSVSARANFEAKIRRSNIPAKVINAIVYGNPTVTVTISGNKVHVNTY